MDVLQNQFYLSLFIFTADTKLTPHPGEEEEETRIFYGLFLSSLSILSRRFSTEPVLVGLFDSLTAQAPLTRDPTSASEALMQTLDETLGRVWVQRWGARLLALILSDPSVLVAPQKVLELKVFGG